MRQGSGIEMNTLTYCTGSPLAPLASYGMAETTEQVRAVSAVTEKQASLRCIVYHWTDLVYRYAVR